MVATDSLLVKDNQNVAPKAHILVQNLNLKISVFLRKTSIFGVHSDCTYVKKSVRSDQATSQMCQKISETCSGGIIYPRTNRADHCNT